MIAATMSVITEYSDFAPRWRRLAAFALDGIFLSIIAWLFFPSQAWILALLVNGLYTCGGNVVGVTPGKYYLRIFIQTRNGDRPGVVRGLVRSAPDLVPILLFLARADVVALVVTFVMFAGYFPIVTHSERRSIYDQLAGTWVVRGRRSSTPAVVI
jgi:uncharacterized RDD family membrane protein YckC